MIIPPERLTTEALRGIVQSFITREGTDYGESELTIEGKTDRLMPQILSGDVVIVFDEESQSVNLLKKDEAAPLR